MTKIEQIKQKRRRQLMNMLAVCLSMVTAAWAVDEINAFIPIWCLCLLSLIMLASLAIFCYRYWNIPRDFRIIKKEVVKWSGHMPISQTYYFAQQKKLWWRNCIDKDGKVTRSKDLKEVESHLKDLMQQLGIKKDINS